MKLCLDYEWNMNKFLISITSDNINILDWIAGSNILVELKFLLEDKKYWF